MRKLRVYIDTSIYGGLHDEEFAEPTETFFETIKDQGCAILASQITIDELDGAPETVRDSFRNRIAGTFEEIPITAEVEELAQAYVDAEVLGEASLADALHVAAATVARADLIVSWNFKHIVNYNRIRKFNGVNALKGYPQIDIRSPLEMEDEDENV
jgi:hypothetical protein